MPSLLERIAAAKRRKNRSAPQNAVLSHAAQGFQTQGFQNHIPARGRKQFREKQIGDNKKFQNHIPARGRKLAFQNQPKRLIKLFQNHIPARGRKLSSELKACIVIVIISKPHPRKGTETFLSNSFTCSYTYFKTTSPQGDGNSPATKMFTMWGVISKPHPRKGTEARSPSLPRC